VAPLHSLNKQIPFESSMDFADNYTCDARSNRAQRRDRDSLMAQDAYVKKQEKKKERRSVSAGSNKGDDLNTPEKHLSQSKRRAAADEDVEGKENIDASAPKASLVVDASDPKAILLVSKEQGAAVQRKRSKSASKRQRQVEDALSARQLKADATQKEEEEEAFAVEAEAATARRRAAWEAKDAAAREAVMGAEAEEEGDAAMVQALKEEAEAAAAAVASIPSPLASSQGAPPKISGTGAMLTTVGSESQDPDLEGWEVL